MNDSPYSFETPHRLLTDKGWSWTISQNTPHSKKLKGKERKENFQTGLVLCYGVLDLLRRELVSNDSSLLVLFHIGIETLCHTVTPASIGELDKLLEHSVEIGLPEYEWEVLFVMICHSHRIRENLGQILSLKIDQHQASRREAFIEHLLLGTFKVKLRFEDFELLVRTLSDPNYPFIKEKKRVEILETLHTLMKSKANTNAKPRKQSSEGSHF